MENFRCKRLHLIILAFRWATISSTRFYTIIQLPLLVGIPFTCSRGRRIHSRCNPRCKTKSPNQQCFNPCSNIENLLGIFQGGAFVPTHADEKRGREKKRLIFCINLCQSFSTRGAHPTIERSIRFFTTSSCRSWFEVKGHIKRQNKIVGVITESKDKKKNQKTSNAISQPHDDSEVCPCVR